MEPDQALDQMCGGKFVTAKLSLWQRVHTSDYVLADKLDV